MNLGRVALIAVGATAPAAMAVSGTAHACPLGIELTLDDPSLTWSALLDRPRYAREWRRAPAQRIAIALEHGTPDAHRIRRAIAAEEVALARCGDGRGELVVRVARGEATATVSGFAPAVGRCVVAAVEHARYARIGDGSIAQLALALPAR